MRIMKGSLEAMEPEPSSRLDRTIQRFKETLGLESPAIGSQVQVLQIKSPEQTVIPAIISVQQHSTSSDSPIQPPPGQIGNAISCCFTSEGGVLYSPVHGVAVTVPPNATPRDVGKIFLSMHFYLSHPFTVEKDVDFCSVVVWFHLHPSP